MLHAPVISSHLFSAFFSKTYKAFLTNEIPNHMYVSFTANPFAEHITALPAQR